MDQTDLAERLQASVGRALGPPVVIEGLTRLPGGASKETWSFTARGPGVAAQRFIVRRDRERGLSGSRLGLEAALLTAAAAVGVPVPSVVATGDGSDAQGAAFLVMEFVDGETIPRRIL